MASNYPPGFTQADHDAHFDKPDDPSRAERVAAIIAQARAEVIDNADPFRDWCAECVDMEDMIELIPMALRRDGSFHRALIGILCDYTEHRVGELL